LIEANCGQLTSDGVASVGINHQAADRIGLEQGLNRRALAMLVDAGPRVAALMGHLRKWSRSPPSNATDAILPSTARLMGARLEIGRQPRNENMRAGLRRAHHRPGATLR
jgi:hypothetical protein